MRKWPSIHLTHFERHASVFLWLIFVMTLWWCDVCRLISVMGLWWCDVCRLISVMGLWWCDVCRLISVMGLWWCDVCRLISVMGLWWCDVCRLISVMGLWWCDVFRKKICWTFWAWPTGLCLWSWRRPSQTIWRPPWVCATSAASMIWPTFTPWPPSALSARTSWTAMPATFSPLNHFWHFHWSVADLWIGLGRETMHVLFCGKV